MLKPIIALLMSGACTDLRAQCASDSVSRLIDLAGVVVTGTRTPKFLKDAPIQTRVITSSDIEKTDATDVKDLLQQELPGVEFSYAMNQQTHLNFAGFGGQGVLFLVDGERLAGETMDDVDFSRLTTAGIERIEIVKGAASALYGSNATGGVINIITMKAERPLAVNLDARMAKHNAQRYGANIGVRKGRWSNTASASFSRTDNFGVQNAPNPATRVVSTVYGDKTLNIKEQLTFTPAEPLAISGRAGYFLRETARSQDIPERYRNFSGGLNISYAMSGRDHLQAGYSFDQYDKSDRQRLAKLEIRHYSNVQNAIRTLYTHTFAGQATQKETGTLTVGADYMHDYLFNRNISGGERHQDCFDVFAQIDWQLTDKWEAVAALRYDYFSDTRNSHLTPKLNLRYKPLHNLTLRAGYGMGFRAPSLKEKYYNFDMSGIWIVEGNKDLKPERSHNFSLSAEYTKGRCNLTASAYYNTVADKIATSMPYFKSPADKLPYLPYTNLHRYNVYGGEVGIQARWANGLSARIAYAYTKEELPKDKDGNTSNNQYIPARAHALNARADYSHDFSNNYGLNVGISGRVLSAVDNEEYADYYDISKGTVTVSYPAYTIWKLHVVQRFHKKLSLTAALDNLFNYRPKYYYLNAPMTDGITVLVGVRLALH